MFNVSRVQNISPAFTLIVHPCSGENFSTITCPSVMLMNSSISCRGVAAQVEIESGI
jgi:hypothetical protein